MESFQAQRRCFLCLNRSYICVNDSLLCKKIDRYLQIVISVDCPTYLCAICIESIETFHEFYERVQYIHKLYLQTNNASILSNTKEVLDSAENYGFNLEKLETLSEPDSEKSICTDILQKNKIPRRKHKISPSDDLHFQDIASDSDESYKPMPKKPKMQIKNTRKVQFYRRKGPSKSSKKVQAVEQDLAQHYNNVTCPLCQDEPVYTTLKALDEHFRESHEEKSFLVCCKKSFKLEDRFRLRRHLKIHLDPDCCRCDICGKTLSTPRHMRLHKQLHIPEADRTFECEECGKKCGGNAELYRHRHTIHTPQHSVCDICGKEFRKRVSFRAHMKHVHEDAGKTYVCEVCARTYKSFASLHQHMNNAHSDSYVPKTKQCPDCGKWLGAMYLQKHITRIHSGRTAYECPKCERVFKLPSDVRSHLVTHSDERPFLCSICGTAFKTKATLKSHLVQHTGGKPVKCTYCGKMISNNNNYVAHRKRMHLEEYLASKRTASQQSAAQESCDVLCEETVVTGKGDCDLFCRENSNFE